jgi:hypothetical protein
MVTISIGKADTKCPEHVTLTSGMVNAVQVLFTFSDEWENFNKIAVFSNGDKTIDVTLEEDKCYIPHEVLEVPGNEVTVGVYGSKGEGEDYVAIPTEKCSLGEVAEGVNPMGEETAVPTPSPLDELRIRVEYIEGNTYSKEEVDALNPMKPISLVGITTPRELVDNEGNSFIPEVAITDNTITSPEHQVTCDIDFKGYVNFEVELNAARYSVWVDGVVVGESTTDNKIITYSGVVTKNISIVVGTGDTPTIVKSFFGMPIPKTDYAKCETGSVSLVGITTSSKPDTSTITENKLIVGEAGTIEFCINYQGYADIEVISSGRLTFEVDGKKIKIGLSTNTPLSWSGVVTKEIKASLTRAQSADEITFNKFIGEVYTDGLMSSEHLRKLNRTRSKLDDYVTPEALGAVADGTTDDSAAIQAAIDTDKQVILTGTYLIKNPIYIEKNHQTLTIDGKLIVDSDVGIELAGAYNTIEGDGEIQMSSNSVGRTAIRIVVKKNDCWGNIISVRKITEYWVDKDNNNAYQNIAIEVTGHENKGGGCFDRITSDINFFRYGIWLHDINSENPNSWYNSLYIHSAIVNCVQAVVIDSCGHGTVINGNIQPLRTDYAGLTEEIRGLVSTLPLIKAAAHCKVDTFLWDLQSLVNSCAIEVGGNYVVINSVLPYIKDKVEVPENYAKYTYFLKERVDHIQDTATNPHNVTAEQVGAVERVEYNSTDGSLQGRVYIVDKNNAQTSKELRITAKAESIPLRNANGNFYVNNPTNQYECVNKGYADANYVSEARVLELIKANVPTNGDS